jgi:hypothetical protein
LRGSRVGLAHIVKRIGVGVLQPSKIDGEGDPATTTVRDVSIESMVLSIARSAGRTCHCARLISAFFDGRSILIVENCARIHVETMKAVFWRLVRRI